MSRRLWSRFSSDYRADCQSWTHSQVPLIEPGDTWWRERWTANPDLLDLDGRLLPHLRVSADGITFPDDGMSECVFRGEPGSWDAQSVVTARIHRDRDTFFMLYGGSANSLDEPEFFGLARSTDLRTWERHPGNPIFGHGAGGTIDGGAIWFPAMIETAADATLLYEGSRGKYAWDLSSRICVATLPLR